MECDVEVTVTSAEKQKARPKGVNLQVRWRAHVTAQFALRCCLLGQHPPRCTGAQRRQRCDIARMITRVIACAGCEMSVGSRLVSCYVSFVSSQGVSSDLSDTISIVLPCVLLVCETDPAPCIRHGAAQPRCTPAFTDTARISLHFKTSHPSFDIVRALAIVRVVACAGWLGATEMLLTVK